MDVMLHGDGGPSPVLLSSSPRTRQESMLFVVICCCEPLGRHEQPCPATRVEKPPLVVVLGTEMGLSCRTKVVSTGKRYKNPPPTPLLAGALLLPAACAGQHVSRAGWLAWTEKSVDLESNVEGREKRRTIDCREVPRLGLRVIKYICMWDGACKKAKKWS